MDALLQLGIGLVVAIIAFFIGAWYQRRIDNKKREKDFYLDYYKDLWMVVQNVDGVIQRGRKIDHQKVMGSILEKYSCADINAYLRNCVKTDSQELKNLLVQFSDNLSEYEQETGRLQYPSMGDGQTNFQEISRTISNKIRNNIISNVNQYKNPLEQ